jgi:hypoxanthine phosphoribosyltransferase
MRASAPRILISEEQIQQRVKELAHQISADYAGRGELVLVGVLKGAFIFLADLARELCVPHTVEFIALSSYRRGTQSGAVRLLMDVRENIEGREVLVVEDIVDTGRTLRYLIELLQTRHPASIRTCALVRKQDRHEVHVAVEYLGFDIPDVWVVGYGLDYGEHYRTLRYIGAVEPATDP